MVEITKVIKHCRKVDQAYGDSVPSRLQGEWQYNQGYLAALEMVVRNYHILNKEHYVQNTNRD